MMSLVRAQLEEPKKKIYLMVYLLFLFLYLDLNSQHYVNIRVLYRLSVAQEVAWRLTAAGGRRREVDKAQWSILSERIVRAIKIGYRKKKHVNHDV